MTHYQKIATMVFRIIGVLVILCGIVLWIFSAVTSFFVNNSEFTLLALIMPCLYLIGGIFLFTVSRVLAKWICLDFDEFNKS